MSMWSGNGNFGTMQDPSNANAATSVPLLVDPSPRLTYTLSRAAGSSFRLTVLVASGDGANAEFATTVNDGTGAMSVTPVRHTADGLYYHVYDISAGSSDITVDVTTENNFSLTGFAVDNLEFAPPPTDVVFVERQTEFYQGVSTNVHTISSFETVDAENRKLVVVTARESGGSDVTGITYGSQSFTQAVAPIGFRKTDIWYLDAPDVGTQDIVVTYSSNTKARTAVMSLQNAVAGAPAHSDAVQSTVSYDLTTTASNIGST